MYRLSKKQIIQFCDETIADIISGEVVFLCHSLKDYIRTKTFWGKYFGCMENLSKYIPEFTYENAVKHANAIIRNNHNINNNNKNNYVWWSVINSREHIYNANDRIKFLEWIKSHYTTPVK